MRSEKIIVTYRIKPTKGLKLHEAAQRMCAEQSTGFWRLELHEREELKDFRGEVREVDHEQKIVKLAYPVKNLDPKTDGITGLLNYITGDVLDSKYIESVRVLDIELPRSFVEAFPGPQFGIKGIRNLLGVYDRPLVGVIIKPSFGLTPEKIAAICKKVAEAGADYIKDDEKLMNPPYCKIEKRLNAVQKALREAKKKTGREVLYGINISSRPNRLLKLARELVKRGANMLMVTIVTAGFDIVAALAEDVEVNVPIYAHRTMHAAFTRYKFHGIDMRILIKLTRIAGADFQHCGAIVGTHAVKDTAEVARRINIMTKEYFGRKPSFPTLSGGITPGNVEANLKPLSEYKFWVPNPKDIAFSVGTAVYAHPDGMVAGVKAMVDAVRLISDGYSTPEATKKSKKLKRWVESFGWLPPKFMEEMEKEEIEK